MNFDNINSADLPHFIYLSLLLVMLASGIIFKSHLKASQLIKQIVMWLIIVLFILVVYSFRYDFYRLKDSVSERISGELFPSKVVRVGKKQIAIAIANDGHFYIDIKINSKPVRFMVDTGASDISMNLSDAKKVGIDVNNLSSFRKYQTANGSIVSGLAVVDKIELAGIKFSNVAVAVNNSDMGTSLLGMSFLRKFERYEFYQDRLVLTTR